MATVEKPLAAARYVPPHPPRGEGPVPVWRGLIGERARTAVYGWSERAFETWHMERNVLGIRVHIPLHPDAVQHVLLDNAANYVKPDMVKKILAPTIGRGLLSSDGADWREQRRIVAARFAPAAVDTLFPAFVGAARGTAAHWGRGGTIDMAEQATATTMRVISDSLFAGDARLTSKAAIDHIAAAIDGVAEARVQVLLGLPLFPMTPKGRRGRRGQIYLRKTLAAVVEDRRRGGYDDFLSRMIEALDAQFPPEEARALAVDNAATFYLAGHETTANALAWALFLLSEQPDLQQAAAAEAREALATGEGDPGLPGRLPLLRRILDETLRLYPSAPRIDRQAVAADRLGEHDVRPGDIVSLWPWLIHRHRLLWEDPDAFDADRWTEARSAGRHRFQYLPFGGGPRVCVGMRMAVSEALTVLSHWLTAWRFAPVPGREVRASGLVTLRPAGGLPLRVTPRD
ncbi:cytochrome P450 [Sphingomonas parva]|uniref:Cytochrome P450 n=1 Tax=Sphingomonas parva TaxID=2555898 RepID=A0A4Y8ZQR1_9SPHN|nr:cytochrome P450 [Sphingomonas parva]TFI56736.1 cytochrome P450 [Sphingomonas parva]